MSLAMAGLAPPLRADWLGWQERQRAAGWLMRRSSEPCRGRLMVQAIGVFAGAPFVVLCGLTQSVTWLIVALAGWGFFKGIYDANIFASPFDVVPPEARGTMAGLMNCVGWLGGGGPRLSSWAIAQQTSLGFAIADHLDGLLHRRPAAGDLRDVVCGSRARYLHLDAFFFPVAFFFAVAPFFLGIFAPTSGLH